MKKPSLQSRGTTQWLDIMVVIPLYSHLIPILFRYIPLYSQDIPLHPIYLPMISPFFCPELSRGYDLMVITKGRPPVADQWDLSVSVRWSHSESGEIHGMPHW